MLPIQGLWAACLQSSVPSIYCFFVCNVELLKNCYQNLSLAFQQASRSAFFKNFSDFGFASDIMIKWSKKLWGKSGQVKWCFSCKNSILKRTYFPKWISDVKISIDQFCNFCLHHGTGTKFVESCDMTTTNFDGGTELYEWPILDTKPRFVQTKL